MYRLKMKHTSLTILFLLPHLLLNWYYYLVWTVIQKHMKWVLNHEHRMS
jgi:hypothetical protein